MSTRLLDIKAIAGLLSTTPGAARGVLERLGVVPIDLGRGRGLGLRWHLQEVLEALEKSRRPRQATRSPRRQEENLILGRPTEELIAELAGQDPMH